MGTRLPIYLVTLLLCQYVVSFPYPQEPEVLVVTTENINGPVPDDKEIKIQPPVLDSMHVISNVSNRYAQTVISSRYKNPSSVSQEATFSIVLPETAFISGFLMQIKDKTYEAYVREKEEAKKEYDYAVQQGIGAAHVAVNARDSNRFTVSMNIEPLSKVVFNLTYEELLVRKHGKYEMVINLNPKQLVKDLTVDVYITETQPLVNVNTPAIRSGNDIFTEEIIAKNDFAEINQIGDDKKAVHVHFAPNIKQQKQMAKKLGKDDEEGLAGQFLIEYDVERNSKGGEILVNDGYFVHFFAPPELKTLPKYVVFVLDVSGSMYGRRIEQLINAMETILLQLGPNDYFNLIEFNSDVKVLNIKNKEASTVLSNFGYYGYYGSPEQNKPKRQFELLPAYPATDENKKAAQLIVKNMTADGGTNIYDALEVGLNMTSAFISSAHFGVASPQPIIIFLTDGDPTVGNTNTNDILNIVAKRNTDNKTAIFSLAFGSDTDKQLLKSVSLKNNGFMRQIYEASDAALQLQDFYKQIASPLLANVTFTYPKGDAVTKNVFHTYFGGSEIVICGMMPQEEKSASVHALTFGGPSDFIPEFVIPHKRQLGSLERLWAYTTIRQLLEKKDELENDAEETKKNEIKKKALDLALKYSFVTALTSLVVVKPNETQKVNTEEANSNNNQFFNSYSNIPANAGFGGAFPMSASIGAGAGYSGGFPGAPASGFAGGFSQSSLLPVNRRIAMSPIDIRVSDDSADQDFLYESETTMTNPTNITIDIDLPWLSPLISNNDYISINGKMYAIGNNSTDIDPIPCTVNSQSGNCTVLSACPQIYPELDTFETYHTKYFCPLASEHYAGVCCVDVQEKHEE